MTSTHVDQPANSSLMDATLVATDARTAEVNASAIVHTEAIIHDPSESKCFNFLKQKELFLKATNFTENELIYHWNSSEPYRTRLGRRGRQPVICDEDSLILLLYWLRHAPDFALVAAVFGFGETATRSAIFRCKEWFLPYLKDRWWAVRMRPRVVTVTDVRPREFSREY